METPTPPDPYLPVWIPLEVHRDDAVQRLEVDINVANLTGQEMYRIEDLIGEERTRQIITDLSTDPDGSKVPFAFQRALVYAKAKSKIPDLTPDDFDWRWRDVPTEFDEVT